MDVWKYLIIIPISNIVCAILQLKIVILFIQDVVVAETSAATAQLIVVVVAAAAAAADGRQKNTVAADRLVKSVVVQSTRFVHCYEMNRPFHVVADHL